MISLRYIALLGIPLLTIGCAGTGSSYRPIVDAPKDAKYEGHLAECQKLSEERKYLNADTKTNALVGAAIGLLLSDDDPAEGIIGGAAIGGGATALGAIEEKKDIIRGCMEGRGYKVIL